MRWVQRARRLPTCTRPSSFRAPFSRRSRFPFSHPEPRSAPDSPGARRSSPTPSSAARLKAASRKPSEIGLLNVWVDAEPAGDGVENGVREALAAGRAVVAVATPANRETLEGGAAGFLVPPEDPNETAHAVLAALFKPELRDPRIARGRKLAEGWRPERRADRLLEIYQRLRS